jgi:hypothetical protein
MVTLPLVWDPFTDLIIGMANSPALQGFRSVLDGNGTATATLNTGGPLPPSTVGLVMYFAYLLYYPVTFYPYDYVSCPVEVTILP